MKFRRKFFLLILLIYYLKLYYTKLRRILLCSREHNILLNRMNQQVIGLKVALVCSSGIACHVYERVSLQQPTRTMLLVLPTYHLKSLFFVL